MLLFLLSVSIIAYFLGITNIMPTLESDAVKKKILQLRWQCRRGMLEIDIILSRYLSESYEKSSLIEQAIFESLLTENDQQLFLWFTGREEVWPKYVDLVCKLRK